MTFCRLIRYILWRLETLAKNKNMPGLSQEREDFSLLYDQFSPKIYQFIYFRTFHKETAEDLTSQTFCKALERYDRFRPDKGGFSAWLYAIARNTLIDHYRSFRPAANIEDFFSLSDRADAPLDISCRQQLLKVRKYLDQIKKEHRDVVIMRLWDDLPFAEIARLAGKSEGACKMIFSRAIKSIRKEVIISLIIILSSLIKT